MCLPTSASGTLEGPEEVLETQIVIKMLPECSPMSQEQIETLISKIWSRMPEIFDQNHDWVADLLSKEPEECDLFTFYAAPSIGLLLHLSKGALVHCQTDFLLWLVFQNDKAVMTKICLNFSTSYLVCLQSDWHLHWQFKIIFHLESNLWHSFCSFVVFVNKITRPS